MSRLNVFTTIKINNLCVVSILRAKVESRRLLASSAVILGSVSLALQVVLSTLYLVFVFFLKILSEITLFKTTNYTSPLSYLQLLLLLTFFSLIIFSNFYSRVRHIYHLGSEKEAHTQKNGWNKRYAFLMLTRRWNKWTRVLLSYCNFPGKLFGSSKNSWICA